MGEERRRRGRFQRGRHCPRRVAGLYPSSSRGCPSTSKPGVDPLTGCVVDRSSTFHGGGSQDSSSPFAGNRAIRRLPRHWLGGLESRHRPVPTFPRQPEWGVDLLGSATGSHGSRRAVRSRSHQILRPRTGTIFPSGPRGARASCGPPEGHSLSVGSAGASPGTNVQSDAHLRTVVASAQNDERRWVARNHFLHLAFAV